MVNFKETIEKAQTASLKLGGLSHEKRCEIIKKIAERIQTNKDLILNENQKDLNKAEADNINPALFDRLKLDSDRLDAMTAGMEKVSALADPLKNTDPAITHANGMTIRKVKVPIGVLLVVYEARPNVSTDTIALALKTGNAAILKGSRQTRHSNQVLGELAIEVMEEYGLGDAIVFYPYLTHEESGELISSDRIDLIIPRGGEKLKQVVRSLARVPVLGAGGGVCHTYVGPSADIDKAAAIIHNAKTQRPSVCNALETVLIHRDLKDKVEEILAPSVADGVRIHYDVAGQEYLDLDLSLNIVKDIDEAITHINSHSTGHSDCIISEDSEEIQKFLTLIDSACVYANVSTRYTDGEEFGFGAEIGISTQKLHARGPIGPTELTTYKYLIEGNGQIR